jgi:hypothetical protein
VLSFGRELHSGWDHTVDDLAPCKKSASKEVRAFGSSV